MRKSLQKMIVIAVNQDLVVAKESLIFHIKSIAMNTKIQKDPACCEPGSVCCGKDGGIGCC